METWHSAATALLCVGALWAATGTQREHPMLARSRATSEVTALETGATARVWDPALSPGATRELMQAYLDAHQPGLAVVLVDGAALQTRNDLGVRHVYARALIDQGRNGEALTVEKGVLAECSFWDDARTARSTGCDGVLLASAFRRTDILEALLAFGIEDTQLQPEASLAAYQNATREARILPE